MFSHIKAKLCLWNNQLSNLIHHAPLLSLEMYPVSWGGSMILWVSLPLLNAPSQASLFCGVNEAWVLVCCFGWLVNCCVLLCFLVVVVGLFWFVWCILGGVLFCCLLGFVAELWAAVPRSQIMASYHSLSHLSSSYLAQEFLYRFCSYLINSIALNAETLKNGSEQGLLAETSSTLKAWHC